jgi:hypothetical protein
VRDWGKSQHPIDAIRHKPVSTAHNVVDQAAATTGLVAIGTSIAALAGSSAAFVVAVGGPQVAITVGVIALAGIVKGAYSNRDRAHRKLQPYVWSLIDDERPTQNIWGDAAALKEAASAATYLMKDASSQYEQMGKKLAQAQEKFNIFWEDYQKQLAPLTAEFHGKWIGENLMLEWTAKTRGKTIPEKSYFAPEIVKAFETFNQTKIKTEKTWAKANKQGNEVFEFMRRLVHVGNYLQCAGIIQEATFVSLNAQGGGTDDPGDVLARWQGAREYRKNLKDISDLLEKADANYARFEQFMVQNNIK